MVIKKINNNFDYNNYNNIYYAGANFKKKKIMNNMFDKLFNPNKNNLNIL